MKLKSVSVENLENVVKQMINAALKDPGQTVKLRQAIYEEWYFKKMIELEDAKDKREKTVREINQRVSLYSTSDLTKNVLSKGNSMDFSYEMQCLSKQDLNDPMNNIKIIDHDKPDKRNIPAIYNKSINKNIYIDHTGRTCKTSNDIEHIASNDTAPSLEIIEIWNYPTQRANIEKRLNSKNTERTHHLVQDNRKLMKQIKKRLSFEAWKNEKNFTYRKLLKELKEKRQKELQEKIREIDHKRAFQEAYNQTIKEKIIQQRKELFAKKMIEQINRETLQRQMDERRIINVRAFNAWKTQKNAKLREAKLTAMKNKSYHQSKRLVDPMPFNITERSSSQFALWLNQLDSVLHKKYLRERRYLVRSSYCQPMYYSAALT